jgi:hypothetical protein
MRRIDELHRWDPAPGIGQWIDPLPAPAFGLEIVVVGLEFYKQFSVPLLSAMKTTTHAAHPPCR